jgi:hypothetical protein
MQILKKRDCGPGRRGLRRQWPGAVGLLGGWLAGRRLRPLGRPLRLLDPTAHVGVRVGHPNCGARLADRDQHLLGREHCTEAMASCLSFPYKFQQPAQSLSIKVEPSLIAIGVAFNIHKNNKILI